MSVWGLKVLISEHVLITSLAFHHNCYFHVIVIARKPQWGCYLCELTIPQHTIVYTVYLMHKGCKTCTTKCGRKFAR